MNRRAARSRHGVRTSINVLIGLAIVVTGWWYLSPVAGEWMEDSDRFSRTVITTEDVNLRSGPGTTHQVISVLPAGSEVAAEPEAVNGFSAVNINGQRGWVASAFLTEPGVAHAAGEPITSGSFVEPRGIEVPAAAPLDQQPLPAGELTSARLVEDPAPVVVPAAQPVIASDIHAGPAPQPGEKWIEVDRTDRTVTLHNGEITVATFDALIGKDLSPDGYYSTAVGTHYVYVKEKALAETPFAEGVYLTDFVGFDPGRSNGFHSPTRDEFGNVMVTGGTATLGCVRLAEDTAVILYDFAHIGMRVEVHD